MSAIEWYLTLRPFKADNGHSPVQVGRGPEDGSGATRQYIRCECGGTYSGRGRGRYHDQGWASHRRHQLHEIRKRQAARAVQAGGAR